MDLQFLAEKYLETKSNRDLVQLLKQIDPLLNKKANEIARKASEEFEDIKQELYLVVIKKISSYDPSRAKFITFANAILRGDPTDIIASKVCHKRGGNGKNMYLSLKSLDAPLGEDGGTLGEVTSSKKDFREDIFTRDIIEQHQKHPMLRKEW